jgi:hypothetical protein
MSNILGAYPQHCATELSEAKGAGFTRVAACAHAHYGQSGNANSIGPPHQYV